MCSMQCYLWNCGHTAWTKIGCITPTVCSPNNSKPVVVAEIRVKPSICAPGCPPNDSPYLNMRAVEIAQKYGAVERLNVERLNGIERVFQIPDFIMQVARDGYRIESESHVMFNEILDFIRYCSRCDGPGRGTYSNDHDIRRFLQQKKPEECLWSYYSEGFCHKKAELGGRGVVGGMWQQDQAALDRETQWSPFTFQPVHVVSAPGNTGSAAYHGSYLSVASATSNAGDVSSGQRRNAVVSTMQGAADAVAGTVSRSHQIAVSNIQVRDDSAGGNGQLAFPPIPLSAQSSTNGASLGEIRSALDVQRRRTGVSSTITRHNTAPTVPIQTHHTSGDAASQLQSGPTGLGRPMSTHHLESDNPTYQPHNGESYQGVQTYAPPPMMFVDPAVISRSYASASVALSGLDQATASANRDRNDQVSLVAHQSKEAIFANGKGKGKHPVSRLIPESRLTEAANSPLPGAAINAEEPEMSRDTAYGKDSSEAFSGIFMDVDGNQLSPGAAFDAISNAESFGTYGFAED